MSEKRSEAILEQLAAELETMMRRAARDKNQALDESDPGQAAWAAAQSLAYANVLGLIKRLRGV